MTFHHKYMQQSILYNFTVYKCDQVSLYVTIGLLFLSAIHKLVYSVNLTS